MIGEKAADLIRNTLNATPHTAASEAFSDAGYVRQ